MDLSSLKRKAVELIKSAETLIELNSIYKRYLGKKGELTLYFKNLKSLSKNERIKRAKKANVLKKFLIEEFNKKSSELKKKTGKLERSKEVFDVTIPGKKIKIGHLHPLTQIKRKIEKIFQSIGFEVVEGYEIEDEWHNFDALNIPKEHPARDLWDTFWLKNGLLLRTHTSPVQIRYMEKHQPPFKIIVPGKVFRHEATDASHDFEFHQIEGLMVGENISVANFKAIVEKFFQEFFGGEIKIRLRPSYFPFVEPGFEADISCPICKGKGCPVCKRSGWIELLGAGMVHPNVLRNSGFIPKTAPISLAIPI